jgi:hypothetical protein
LLRFHTGFPLTALYISWHGVGILDAMNKSLPLKTLTMKKLLSVVGVAAIMASCNSNPNIKSADQVQAQAPAQTLDTAGLAQFQAWKAQNELMRTQQQEQYMQYQQMQNAGMYGYAAPSPQRSYASAPRRSTSTARRSSSGNNGGYASTGNYPARKKGWSKAAKGAAIGGAGGAVLGAVINKRNRVAGGVIGGVIGAGVGYGIGRSQDKKDGRY